MKKMIKTMLSFAAVVSAVTFSFVSCGPEGPVGEGEGDGQDKGPTEEQLAYADSLETALYKQARAMQVVLTSSEEPVLVSSCVAEEAENTYTITLTTGASFPIFIDNDETYADALSYVESEGKKFWAICDKDGNIVPVEDADGAGVELSATFDIEVADGKCSLKLGETSYDMGYNCEDKVQIFDCTLLEDNSGVVYAVVFDFGADKTKIVYVADYSGFYFYLPSDESKAPVSEIYVNMTGKATVAANLPEDIAWTLVAPESVSVSSRNVEGISYVDLDIAARNDLNGEQKLQAVSEDGTFVFAEIALTSKQFRSLSVSMTDAIITPTTGVGKFAYGLSLYNDFNEDEILALSAGLIDGTIQPSAGNSVSEEVVVEPFETILGAPMGSEDRYILWAVADGVLFQIEVTDIDVDIEVKSEYLLDADVNVTVSGVKSLFGGLIEVSDEMLSTILYQVNNLVYTPVSVGDKFEYEGAASEFPVIGNKNVFLSPQTSYALWVVPVVNGEYEYTEKDIIFKEFDTKSVTSGGSLELLCSEPVATISSLSFDLSCEGASMIYYAFLNSKGSRYLEAPNEAKFEQIVMADSDNRMGDYKGVIGNKVTAVSPKLNDEAATEYWLYAVAVDADGKYGKVHCVSAKTLALAYDTSISLTVESLEVKSNEATFKVTSTGDLSDYIYWVGRTTDPFYRNSTHCNESKSGAQKYMAINPDDENITACMRKYGRLAEDGTITIDDMTMETTYVFIILEKGELYYSPVGYKLIRTLAADLGEIVREGSAEWNAAKNAVKLEWHKQKFDAPMGLMASYGFNFSCPDNLTAYVMAASDNYFTAAGITKMEHIMIAIENHAGAIASNNGTPLSPTGELMSEPDYYKNGTLVRASLMNVYEYYAHGNPMAGSVTYFAKGSHGKDECYGWENGHCTQYDECAAKIQRFLSREPWENRAAGFGLEGQEKEAWVQALQEAYNVFYKDAKPHLYENDGKGIDMYQPYGSGPDDSGIIHDRVVVMFKDLQGNYYEPMYFEVPNYFEK